ncbi:SOS response-associated peptidase [Streptomyces capparidis]
MCGRYAASRKPDELGEIFAVRHRDPAEDLEADWNVAPTKNVWAVLERPLKGGGSPDPVRQLRVLRWGLVPPWSKTPESAAKMINARAETVHEKPSYRKAFATRRCLLPADGYYEWVTPSEEFAQEQRGARKRPRKQPYFVTPADGSVMAMAGIFEFWRDRTLPDDHPRAWWVTCAVLTTEAEAEPFADPPRDGPRSLAEIHPRMPLVLEPGRWDAWLDPADDDPDRLRELLAPPAPGLLRAHPVSPEVSNVRNNSPDLVRPLQERAQEEETTLF